MRILRLFTLLALAALCIVPAAAQESTPTPPTSDLYRHPGDLFTAPVPAGWLNLSSDLFGQFRNPETGAELFLAAIESEDVDIGQRVVLSLIDPDFSADAARTAALPELPSGVWTQTLYLLDEGQVAAAAAQARDGVVYVVLLRGSQSAVEQANVQFVELLRGFRFGDDAASDDPVEGGTAARILDDALLNALESSISAAVATFEIPAAVVAVVDRDGIRYLEAFGDGPGTGALYNIASVTKPLTTALVADLAAEGLVDWEARVSDLAPGFALADPTRTASLRLIDLLGATHGVARNDLAWIGRDLTPDEVYNLLGTAPLIDAPGVPFSYSNLAFAAGGYLAADAAEGDYDALLQTRLLDPLGMADTTLSPMIPGENPALAIPHDITLAGEIVPTNYHEDLRSVAPAMAAFSTAADLAAFLQMQLNDGAGPDGAQIIPAAALAITRTPRVELALTDAERLACCPLSDRVQYAPGWFVDDYRGVRLYHHGGDSAGSSALVAFMPEAGVGIVVLNNRFGANGFNYSLMYRLAELLYDLEPQAVEIFTRRQEQVTAELAALSEALQPSVTVEAVQPYLGDYVPNTSVELSEDNRLLIRRGTHLWQLWELVPGQYWFANGALIGQPLIFSEGADGTVSLLVGGVLPLARSAD